MAWRNDKTCIHGKRATEPCLECGEGQREFYSPRVLWRARKLAEGKCVNCGQDRGESPYKNTCVECGGKPAKRRRRRLGGQRWREGKRGRPPLTVVRRGDNNA
jgi:hypothetical protein